MSVLLTIAAFIVSASTVALGAEKVVFSQIVHRHGSRSPILPADADANSTSKICPNGCGVLNAEGSDMLVKLGDFIRSRYGTLNPTYFPSTEYVFSEMYTRSTGVPRTIQSAEAFIKGIFPNSTALPVVFNIPREEDKLLLSDSWPNFFFYFQSNLNNFYQQLADTRKSLITDTDMASMAAELSLLNICPDDSQYVRCAVLFFDIAAAFEATGDLATYPTVDANYANLKEMAFEWFSLVYGWDSAKESDLVRGSPGQPAVQKLIANMKDFIAGKQQYKYIHYSAHDSTISPMGTTVGYRGKDIIVTGFGVFMGFDLIEDGGAYFVRAIKGQPQQVPGPHTIESSVLQLGGIDADGNIYYVNSTTVADRVPFDDFVRYVDSTVPRGDKGQCSVPQSQLEAMGCVGDAAPTTAICRMYRTQCMASACPTGKTLDFSTLACVAARDGGEGESTMTTANAGVMAMCTAFGGMLIGAGVMFAINFFAKKRSTKGYETVNDGLAQA